MNEEKKEVIIEIIENILHMAEGPTSSFLDDSIHKEGLIGSIKEIQQIICDDDRVRP